MHCPDCGITWESENTIPEDLHNTGLYGSIEKCEEIAENYGWTKENYKRFSVNVIYCKEYEPGQKKRRFYKCENCGGEF